MHREGKALPKTPTGRTACVAVTAAAAVAVTSADAAVAAIADAVAVVADVAFAAAVEPWCHLVVYCGLDHQLLHLEAHGVECRARAMYR